MGRKIPILKIIGKTEDDRSVYSGIYKFQNTHGVSLSDALLFLMETNSILCWKSYIEECRFFGRNINSAKIDILNSVVDSGFISNKEIEKFSIKLDKIIEGL